MPKKMTRMLLENYKKYKRQINLLDKEIQDMLRESNGIVSDIVLDYSSGQGIPSKITGFDKRRYEELRKRREKRQQQVDLVDNWLETIEDADVYRVMKERYVEGKSWKWIAAGFNNDFTEDYVRITFRDRYLKKHKIF